MSADSESASREDQPGVERLLTLSDGVVAIALTLLVLQLKVPPPPPGAGATSVSELARRLGDGGDQLISYLISFYVIAQFWLVHYRVFRRVAGQREGLVWWNFAFLFTITVMPFTSDLLGEYASNPLAVDIFAVNLLLASLATMATLQFGRRAGLLITRGDSQEAWAERARGVAVSLVIALSIGLAWVNTDIAKYSWLLLAVVPSAVERWAGRRSRRQTTPPETDH